MHYKVKQTKTNLQKYFHLASLYQLIYARAKKGLPKVQILKKTTGLCYYSVQYTIQYTGGQAFPHCCFKLLECSKINKQSPPLTMYYPAVLISSMLKQRGIFQRCKKRFGIHPDPNFLDGFSFVRIRRLLMNLDRNYSATSGSGVFHNRIFLRDLDPSGSEYFCWIWIRPVLNPTMGFCRNLTSLFLSSNDDKAKVHEKFLL